MPNPPTNAEASTSDADGPFLQAFPHPLWGGDDADLLPPIQYDRMRGWWEEHWPLREHAGKCPPLTLANQYGWVLRCPFDFTATWHGSSEPASVTLTPGTTDPRFATLVTAHVGGGCISINTGHVWRSSRDVLLWTAGVPNLFKAGAHCFSALVETDWLLGGFALVYRLTHPGEAVTFRRGEPIGHVLPVRRELVESLRTAWVNDGPDYVARMREFALFDLRRERTPVNRDYARGLDARGVRYPEHQNHTRQGDFARERLPPPDAQHRWKDQPAFWDAFLDAEDRAAIEARGPVPPQRPAAGADPVSDRLRATIRDALRSSGLPERELAARLEGLVREEAERLHREKP